MALALGRRGGVLAEDAMAEGAGLALVGVAGIQEGALVRDVAEGGGVGGVAGAEVGGDHADGAGVDVLVGLREGYCGAERAAVAGARLWL